MKKLGNVWIYIVAAFCLVLFCSIPVVYGVFPLNELPMNFIGAAMGAVITGVITVVLLKGQSDAEEIKERNVKLFEKKSQLFQDFIEHVWKIWTNEKITCDEYEMLTSDYYKNLVIYIKDVNKLNTMGRAISGLGNCLETESYENSKSLKSYIIDIINTLSDELGLGGKIDEEQKKQMDDHDYKLFIVKFRKAMLESFNKIFVSSYSDIFDEGQWIKWNEGNMIHDDLVFNFKNYHGCSIRLGFAKDANGTYTSGFVFILYVPVGAGYHGFDDYRANKKGLLCRRIITKGYIELYQEVSKGDIDIPPFNFEEKDKIINIRENYSYQEIAEALAQRIKKIFGKITIEKDNSTIPEFIEKYIKE